MANILKQSTAIKVRVGPFMDATDAVTPETGVALGTADQAELLKADGAATVDISAATWAAVTGADGWYDLSLTTSHTDTVGELVVVVQDTSLCLPVFARFQVVEEAIYDALYGASASGFDANGEVTVGAYNASLDFNTTQKASINTEADTALTDYDPPTKAELDAGLAALNDPTAAAIADAVLDEALSGHVTAGTLGKAVADIETDATAILADTGTDGVVLAADQAVDVTKISGSATAADNLEASALGIVTGQAQTGTLTTTTMTTNLTEATDDHYNGRIVVFTSGVLAGQATDITDYNGTTKLVTMTALTEAPGNGDTFVIV